MEGDGETGATSSLGDGPREAIQIGMADRRLIWKFEMKMHSHRQREVFQDALRLMKAEVEHGEAEIQFQDEVNIMGVYFYYGCYSGYLFLLWV